VSLRERSNDWLWTAVPLVWLTVFFLVGVYVSRSTSAALEQSRQEEQEARTHPDPWADRFIIPQTERTWADLFAACRLTDAWLGSDIDGEPQCYPMGQTEAAR